MALRPGGQMVHTALPTRSQMLPILSKYRELPSKSQLVPAVLTVVVIMALFTFARDTTPIIFKRGQDPTRWLYTSQFILILGIYLVLLSLQFLYSLAGKAKNWFGLLGVMAFTLCFMQFGGFDLLYPFFYNVLAGGEPSRSDTIGVSLWKHFAGTGFLEELTKAIPLLLLVSFASQLSPEQKRKFGIEEPLDGILLGAASAGGFVLFETIGQYVSNYLVEFWINLARAVTNLPAPRTYADAQKLIDIGSSLAGAAPGLQLLIPRGLRSCFGHMAYSGYFGYFIGLAVLKPQRRWMILLTGFVSAAFVHALWDTVPGDLPKVAIAVLCYAILMAAVLKARELSPNASILAPSVLFGYSTQKAHYTPTVPIEQPRAAQPANPPLSPAPAYAVAAATTPAMLEAATLPAKTLPRPPANPVASVLRLGQQQFAIVPGLLISEQNAPALQAQTPGGPVAQIVQNPNDPAVLGLTNLSRSVWEALSPGGNRHVIQPWQTLLLTRGTRIFFGNFDGEVL